MYLKKRKNDSRKASLVWKTTFVQGVAAKPFLSTPGKALRERDFAYAVQRNPVTGGPVKRSEKPQAQTSSMVDRINKTLRDAGMYGKGSGSGTGRKGSR
jgi:hypothetical protein